MAAACAEKIAAASCLNPDKAYALGLLHDIGSRFGISHMAHAYKGWKYMLELGYPDVAKICLTHSIIRSLLMISTSLKTTAISVEP